MAAPPHAHALSEREEAMVQEVAALLMPVLDEIDRKVDSIIQKLSDLLAQLDTDSIHAPGHVGTDGQKHAPAPQSPDEAMRAYLADEHGKARTWPEHEKARMWDELAAAIMKPGLRDTLVRQVSARLRAVSLLLASREELPPALSTELDSYKVTLDAMHLEAADGFADAHGVINLLPTHIVVSLIADIAARHEAGLDMRFENEGNAAPMPCLSVLHPGFRWRGGQRGDSGRAHEMTGDHLPPGTYLLSPDSCMLDDIPDPGPGDAVPFPIAACQRCGFQFPVVPGIFREITVTAMRDHGCNDGEHRQKWEAAANAIVEGFTNLGAASAAELARHLRDEQEAAVVDGERLALRHKVRHNGETTGLTPPRGLGWDSQGPAKDPSIDYSAVTSLRTRFLQPHLQLHGLQRGLTTAGSASGRKYPSGRATGSWR
jgi:hypothetical protein